MNFTIYCLKKNYKFYINILKKIQCHIYNLLKKNLISNTEKNMNINNLFTIQISINSSFEHIYNNNKNINNNLLYDDMQN